MKVFVDSSAWISIEVANDINHKASILNIQKLKRERVLFFTNEYVLAETYTRLIYDINLAAAKKFHDNIKLALKEEGLTILEVDYQIREVVWAELTRYADHKLSFTDATIVVNFKHYKLDEIFTFDKHFKDINLPTNL